eukprot:GHVU01168005.1.p2 GENE.GHVU01168005.1~~GHVU01168005.1.p2  ORF type:complete len:118 (+),score=14.33 GHVU01168005.1:564-917(+)
MTALTLLWLQLVAGLVVFSSPAWPAPAIKAAIIPYHRGAGIISFVFGLAAMISGIMQKQSFLRAPNFSDKRSTACMLANVLCLVLLALAALVMSFLKPTEERKPAPEGLTVALLSAD